MTAFPYRVQRFTFFFIPNYRIYAHEENTALAFQTDVLDVGNQLGNDQAVFLWTHESQIKIKLSHRAIIWEVTFNGTRYKLEVTLPLLCSAMKRECQCVQFIWA
jgi:hypothetical protein